MLRCLSFVSVVAVVLGVAAVVSLPPARMVNPTRRRPRRHPRRPELMPIRALTYHAGFSTS